MVSIMKDKTMKKFKVWITQIASVTVEAEDIWDAAREALKDFRNEGTNVEYFVPTADNIQEIEPCQ
jgi:hypothetical protein